jgi:hypothetical protein
VMLWEGDNFILGAVSDIAKYLISCFCCMKIYWGISGVGALVGQV